MPNAPLIEQAELSTRRLAWYDDMIRHYSLMQYHTGKILEAMNLQDRIDSSAATVLHHAYGLSLEKLAALNTAREKHFQKHDALMQRILDGEE